MDTLTLVFTAGTGMTILAWILALVRFVRGPTPPDRLVALDLFGTLTIGSMALYTIVVGNAAFLRVGIVLALVGFIGTVALSRYVLLGRES